MVGESASEYPAALVRGGSFFDGTGAGPYAIDAREPFEAENTIGFRCVR